MIALTGATIVLADRAVGPGNLVLDGDRIAEVAPTRRPPSGAREVDLHGCFIVPGFVDVHVHGVEGCDTLDAPSPIAEIARRLTRYGVTAFCPTTVACSALLTVSMVMTVSIGVPSMLSFSACILPIMSFIAGYMARAAAICSAAPAVIPAAGPYKAWA